MNIFAQTAALCIVLLIGVTGWFFTLLVDIPLLILGGYVITFMTFWGPLYDLPKDASWLRQTWSKVNRYLRVYMIFAIPLNVLMLWLGGILPYFNLMEPEAVYFHVLPKEWLGKSGNDFMWNGLLLPIFGPILPVAETQKYLLFNVYAVLIWISYPFVLTWSSLKAFAHTQLDSSKNLSWQQVFFPEFFKMLLLAIGAFVLLSGLALGIARLYNLI